MIQITTFDRLEGEEIPLLTLSDGDVSVELIPWGGSVRAIRVPDREGRSTDICLGYGTLAEYREQDACFGGIIGRCANRIGNARFTLGGQEYLLTPNEGANQLHGGLVGFHQKLWGYSYTDASVTFTLDSPDGEEGYPGNLHVEVTYTLKDSTLTIDYLAVTDRDTVVNLTNHAYFNLAGHRGGPVDDHLLTLASVAYTPAGEGNIPTGDVLPVAGTPLDFSRPTPLGARREDPLLTGSRGYDHNYVLDVGEEPAARLVCPRTGIGLEMNTSLEGMQLYSSGFLTPRKGKDGAVYGEGHGVCLETQHFPDAVNHPGFPSPVLRAGEVYQERTSYRFFAE